MKLKKILSSVIYLGMLTSISLAGTLTWDGEASPGDNDWTTALNWDGDVVPNNGDYGDFAEFTDTYIGLQTANIDGTRKVQGVIFDNTSGWAITGSQLTLRTVDATGTGTNTMNTVKTYQNNNSWTIGSGSILALNDLYIDGAYDLDLSGGGSMMLNNRAGGWSGGKSITVNDATLEVAGNFAFSSAGTVYLGDAAATILLVDSVSNVQARIGSSIIDNTALGLSVTDIGGGVSQVSVIPEPSTAALVLLSGLTAFCVVRKRKS